MFAPGIVKRDAKTTAPSKSESLMRRPAGRRSGEGGGRYGYRLNLGKIPIHGPEETAGRQMEQTGTSGGADTSQEPLTAKPPQGEPAESDSPTARKTPAPPHPRTPDPSPVKGAKPAAPPSAVIASETVAEEPGARTRTTLGVGEEVKLTYSGGITNWATTAGTLSGAKGASTTLTAPDVAKQATVTAGTATITFTVIAPNIVFMERFPGTGVSHTKGRPDSGIQTTSFLGPDTVNFYNIRYREVNVPAMGTGVYKPFDQIGHDPHPRTIRMRDNVVGGMGTQSRVKDRACSGDPATPAPFENGTLLYVIPNEYQLGDGAFHQFAYVTQMSMYNAANSALYTFKAGARGLTSVDSATSNPEMCENPAGSGTEQASQRSKSAARRRGGNTVEPELNPDHQPDDTVVQDPARKHDQTSGRELSWNFSRIQIRPPDRASGPPPSFRLAGTPLTHFMQTKLVAGEAEDPLEREADRVAAQVVRVAAPETSHVPVRLSRKGTDCEKEEAQPLQRQRAGGTGFGHDFAHVSLHSDGAVAETSKSVKARAYTTGERIFSEEASSICERRKPPGADARAGACELGDRRR